jgi:hypothetical protein
LETRTAPHHWTAWEYLSERACRQERTCTRCAEHDERLHHQWGVWDYESPRSCVQVRFCRRCQEGREEKEPSDNDHDWGEPKRIDCDYAERKCNRCKETDRIRYDYDKKRHVYGSWEGSRPGRVRKCRECGHTDYER